MARRATGGVVPPRGRNRSWAIRFRAYGKRHFIALGRPEDGWNRQRTESELRQVLADVERGIWKPYEPPTPKGPVEIPTFEELASEWLEVASPGWKESTAEHYRWALGKHLLPFFAKHRITAITVKEVDRYRGLKVRDSKQREEKRRAWLAKQPATRGSLPQSLSIRSINNTIRVLGTVLELAVEYGYIQSNPAQGRKRLLREPKRSRSYLQPEQVAALLKAAGKLDRDTGESDSGRRQPLLAVLALAGLRISEALDLRWRDVDPSARWFQVAEAKTHAGIRQVHLTPVLRKLLLEYRLRTPHSGPNDRVFPTKKGKRDNPSNIRNRLLTAAVRLANEELRRQGHQEIADITPHSLRRTYISLELAAGSDVPYVMKQAGHSDPRMTLSVYAGVIASKTDRGAAVDSLIGGI
jgi:integrase